MRKLYVPVILAGTVAAIVSAQTLVEHATAAAGGTAAAAAGKKVSEGIDSVFGKLGSTLKDAAGTKDDKNKPRRTIDPAPPIPEARLSGGVATPAVTPILKPGTPAVAVKRSGSTLDSANGALVPTPAVAETPAATVPPPPQPTAGDIAGLMLGTSRTEVAEKLGKPSSRITMDDDGQLVEVYSYRSQGASIGSIRLVNGQVTETRPAK